MKLIDCPVIGARPISEFVYGGELRQPPLEEPADRESVGARVFNRSGAPGVRREWWHHLPTGRCFVLDRDTRDDRVLRAVPSEEVAYAVPTL